MKPEANLDSLFLDQVVASGAQEAIMSTAAPALKPRRYLLLGWLGLRLAVVGAGLYFAPDEMAWLGTILAIHLVGTLPERLILFLGLALIVSGSFSLARRFSLKGRWRLLPWAISFIIFLLLLQRFSDLQPVFGALFLTALLVLNVALAGWWSGCLLRQPGRWLADLGLMSGIGLAELLLPSLFLSWLRLNWLKYTAGAMSAARFPWQPGAVMVSALAALLLSPYDLAAFHRGLFPDPAVQLFTQGNFNGLELDLERRRLYTAGFGVNYLQVYDMDRLDQPAEQSPVETGYAQGFGYNPIDQELYVYHQEAQKLLALDAATLNLKKTIPMPQLSPGDAWVVWDRFSDRIIIASEADEEQGFPFVVIDRASGDILATLDLAPGCIYLDPTGPRLYMSFFRRNRELIVYDTQALQIVKRVPVNKRLDRMIFVAAEEAPELWAPSAIDSTILRFEVDNLAPKGSIPSLFGARAIAVDPARHLLLSGSLVTNMLEVIDLERQERLASYYIGPWLRTINLDTEAGIAYISTHEGLFKVRYASQGVLTSHISPSMDASTGHR